MAVFGFPKLKIELDASVGGALTDISADIRTINGWTVESLLEELTAAGDNTDRWGVIGFTQKSDVVIEGPYDNTASHYVAIVKAAGVGSTLSLRLTFDVGVAADVVNVETIISKLERVPANKALTNLKTTLKPTGAIT